MQIRCDEDAIGATDDQLRLLTDERKSKNTEYHDIPGSSRVDFWNNISNTINERFRTSYTGYQCKNRFQNLVRDYNLMCQYIAGSKPGKRSRAGGRYFEEFKSILNIFMFAHENAETPFDILHNVITSTRNQLIEERDENNAGENPTHNNIRDFSSNNLANNTSTHNADMPASQNDSDASMPDIRVELAKVNMR
ncbi:hypothetical protein Glove_590g28 [Diversispora epigaea]|uniref:Myb/SANT-like domain-containing protein n=1 Tax=Diversispora epigaea TaxID=1348612 RepID=A0A397GGC7_9GLOM|nr:hypothetical protein Glove_590g28 [Diversispora epigaea]